MQRIKLLISAVLLFCISAFAQKVNVQVSTNKPIVGVPFEIAFHLNSTPENYTPPIFKNFNVISGPNQSQNVQFINGNMSQSFSISYVLIPLKEGSQVIGAAKFVTNNQAVYSNPITIEVQKNENANAGGASQNHSNNNNSNEKAVVAKDEIFVKTSVNKTKCFIGEQITLTQKIYTRIDLKGLQNVKFPHLEGFWTKNQERNSNIQLHIETLNGVNYYVGEIHTNYIFPQRSGKLTIDPIELDCVVRKQLKRAPKDIFEQFFGVNSFEDVQVKLKSQSVIVNVEELPSSGKPENFNGAVGKFTYKAELSKNKIPANEAITLKITISGKGNLPLIGAPQIQFPENFETYEPKVLENINTSNGVSGSKTYEYLVIPRKEGDYSIQNISFSYFDIEQKKYISIPAADINITVTPAIHGNNSSAQIYQNFKQEVKDNVNDIRYIKVLPYSLEHQKEIFFNSYTHLTLLFVPLIALGILIGYKKHHDAQMSDILSYNQKHAQKIAIKHLQKAELLLKQNDKNNFYTAITNAMDSYIEYRFKISRYELSKERVLDVLIKNNISSDLQQKYIALMDTCELAKYAPTQSSAQLVNIYDDAKFFIINTENQLKNV